MSFKRKILMSLAAVTLPVSTGLFILGSGPASAVTKFDNSHDTVTCRSIVLGKITITPALSVTGDTTTPTTIKVGGKLFGCTDGAAQLNAKGNVLATDFEGVLAGTLTGTGTAVTNLSGCSNSSGTLTISWLATAGATEPLLYPHTVINVSHVYGGTFVPDAADGGSPLGTGNLTTDGYGSFTIGTDAVGASPKCPSSTSETAPQGFGGPGGVGANNDSYDTTAQDFSMFLENQEDNATLTTSTINLAVGESYFG